LTWNFEKTIIYNYRPATLKLNPPRRGRVYLFFLVKKKHLEALYWIYIWLDLNIMAAEYTDGEVVRMSLDSYCEVPVETLPVHTVEQVARSMLDNARFALHYDDGLLDALGDVREVEFRARRELIALSERLDVLRFRLTTQLSLLMTDEEMTRYINDLDAARDRNVDEYELCRTIRFLHDTGCQLLHWI